MVDGLVGSGWRRPGGEAFGCMTQGADGIGVGEEGRNNTGDSVVVEVGAEQQEGVGRRWLSCGSWV